MAGPGTGVLMIATVGEDTEAVLVGVRDYPVRRLVLLFPPQYRNRAEGLVTQLTPLRIEVELREVSEADMLMDTLRQVASIHADAAVAVPDIILNVSSGEKMQTCSALSAAFVNGIPAIGVAGDSPFTLPVLKFSYRELISEAKFRIMETLRDMKGQADSLADLSEQSGVEKSLLSYHLRTTREGKGLEDMGLVHIERGSFGRLTIKLTEMGELLLVGRGRSDAEVAA